MRKIKLLILVGILMLLGTTNVNALKINSHNFAATPHGVRFYLDDGNVGHCVDYNHLNAPDGTSLVYCGTYCGYLEYSGTPHMDPLNYICNNDALGLSNYLEGNGPTGQYNSSSWGCTPGAINSVNNCNSDGDLKLGNVNAELNLTQDETHYITSEINVGKTGIFATSNYTISLQTALIGTYVVDSPTKTKESAIVGPTTSTTKVEATTNSSKLYIKVPVASVTSSVNKNISLSISATESYTCNNTYNYVDIYATNAADCGKTSGFDYQRIAVCKQGGSNVEKDKTSTDSKNFIISTGDLKIIKTNAETGERMKDVEFILYADAANTKLAKHADGTPIGVITTKSNGQAVVENIKYGTYYLKENKIDGYKVMTNAINVVLNQDVEEVPVSNVPILIKIIKIEAGTGNRIANATIVVKDTNGKIIREFFTTTNDNAKDNYVYFPAGNYIIEEPISPAGYATNPDAIQITVDEEGKVTITKGGESEYYSLTGDTITIINEKSNITISKLDIANSNELPGATIVIKNEAGEVVETWESGTTPYSFYLPIGTYTLEETIAPEGYKPITNSLKFRIKADGNVEAIGNADDAYFLESNRITIFNGTIPEIVVPKTSTFIWVGSIIISAAVIFIGVKFIYKSKNEKKI